MKKDNTIIKETLLKVKEVETTLKKNSKDLFRSLIESELNDMVKNKLNEAEEEEEEDKETEEEQLDKIEADLDSVEPKGEEEEEEEEEETEAPESDLDAMEVPDSSDTMTSTIDSLSNDDEKESGSMDMTDASMEDVVSVYKKMGPQDSVKVKKTDDGFEMETETDNYLVKMNENSELMYELEVDDEFELDDEETEDDDDFNMDDEINEDDFEMEYGEEPEESEETDEAMYEIELDDEESENSNEGVGRYSANHTNQRPRTGRGLPNDPEQYRQRPIRPSISEISLFEEMAEEINDLKETVKSLTNENTEYKNSLTSIKGKLNEFSVFSTKLALVNKLFVENTTSKEEKLNIIESFDSAKDVVESKELYKTFKTKLSEGLDKNKNIGEIISDSKVKKAQIFQESTVYQDPYVTKMKRLMGI